MTRQSILSLAAWLALLIGSVALAMAWRSVAVQGFLEALRSAS